MARQESSVRSPSQDHHDLQSHGPSECDVAQSQLSAADRSLQQAHDRRVIEGRLAQTMGMLGTSGAEAYRGLSDYFDLDSDEKRAKFQKFQAQLRVKNACEK